MRGSFRRSEPASMTRTESLGSALSRLAGTSPAVPPPTMMKSKAASLSGDVVEVIVVFLERTIEWYICVCVPLLYIRIEGQVT